MLCLDLVSSPICLLVFKQVFFENPKSSGKLALSLSGSSIGDSRLHCLGNTAELVLVGGPDPRT